MTDVEVKEFTNTLSEKGFAIIENFFTKRECLNILNKFKTTLNNTLNPVLPGNENDGKNLKIGNEFYGKKNTHWELFKVNVDEKDIVSFVDGLSILDLGVFKSSQIVVRKKFNDNVLPCHVDNLYDDKVVYYNCGIYLSDTCDKDRVYFVEGSNKIPTKTYTFNESEVKKTYLTAKTGDLIVHNSYTWHGSDNSDKEGRTTLYIKFQKDIVNLQ